MYWFWYTGPTSCTTYNPSNIITFLLFSTMKKKKKELGDHLYTHAPPFCFIYFYSTKKIMGTFDFFRILLKKDSSSKKSNKSSTKSETTVESPTTSTTTSSTFNEYAEHGRRYHGRSDASYILPNDEEG